MQNVKVELLGRTFNVRTDDDPVHIQGVAEFVNQRCAELQAGGPLPVPNVALLAALTIADELLKEREKNAAMRRKLRSHSTALLERLESIPVV